MLVELRIKNFAIIDHLELSFSDGLTIFTGETGAGKSIIIDAVETLLGGRADSSLIRTGMGSASVEGTFLLSGIVNNKVIGILRSEEIESEDKYISLSREFKKEGRNTARINGELVNLNIFKQVGDILIDLHGQSEHLSLLRVHHHIELLDSFAEVSIELEAYQKVFGSLMGIRKKLKDLRDSEKNKVDKIELLKFQVEEINSAKLISGEEESLVEERIRLSNSENLSAHASKALDAIDNNDLEIGSAVDKTGEAVQELLSLSKVDGTQEKLAEEVNGIFDGLGELASKIRNYLEEIEFNPERLEEVEERLGLISHLKRKYGENIDQVILSGEKAALEVDNIADAKEMIILLEANEVKVMDELSEKALILSSKRHSAAEQLTIMVEDELQDLRNWRHPN